MFGDDGKLLAAKMANTCRLGLVAGLAGLLICSANCASTTTRATVEPCKNLMARTPEVQSGPGCKEIEAPVLLDCVDPDYPSDVRRQRIEGKVFVRAILTPDGSLEDMKVLASPSESLTELAIKAFRRWRYKPAFCRDSGKSLRVFINMTATFSLRGRR